eukprot:m.275765 g.275765  ORF g.275765 m.275765 type:complete len:337 (+) comp15698_c0_seq7:176-1186(+)
MLRSRGLALVQQCAHWTHRAVAAEDIASLRDSLTQFARLRPTTVCLPARIAPQCIQQFEPASLTLSWKDQEIKTKQELSPSQSSLRQFLARVADVLDTVTTCTDVTTAAFVRNAISPQIHDIVTSYLQCNLANAHARKHEGEQDTNLMCFQELHIPTELEHTSSAIAALTVEKYGVAPQVQIVETSNTSPSLSSTSSLVTLNASLSFLDVCLREVIKNAFAASIRKYGIDADLAPPIILTATLQGEFMHITCQNSGDPIPLNAQPSLFNWFCSTNTSTRDSYKFSSDFGGSLQGQGVGLAMCHAYASALGGTVWLGQSPMESASGATFHLKLPCFN